MRLRSFIHNHKEIKQNTIYNEQRWGLLKISATHPHFQLHNHIKCGSPTRGGNRNGKGNVWTLLHL